MIPSADLSLGRKQGTERVRARRIEARKRAEAAGKGAPSSPSSVAWQGDGSESAWWDDEEEEGQSGFEKQRNPRL